MDKTLALITAGGRLDLLSNSRSKSALPFAGKYRLIDFTLSNCINSGIENIGVITQYMPLSLKEHLGIGKPWDLDRKNSGLTILQPYKGKPGPDWYQGDAQAVFKHLSYIKNKKAKEVLILPGNLVYKMDYQKLISKHRENNADLTIAANNIPYSDARHFSVLNVNQNSKILGLKRDKNPANNLVSMGVYVFNLELLYNSLVKYCSQGAVSFEEDIIPKIIADKKDVFLYNFEGYWRNIRTVQSYFKSNLECTENIPEINLYDDNWPLYTRSESKPPVKLGKNSHQAKSLIANGAIVNGRVINSVISPGVFVEEGSIVLNSIILNNSQIKKNSTVDKAIVDKNVVIEENVKIGLGNDFTTNSDGESQLKNGLNLIAKDVSIAENIKISRNCRVLKDIKQGDFEANLVKSGTTVE